MNQENLLSLTILFYVYWRSLCLKLWSKTKTHKGIPNQEGFSRYWRYEMYFGLIKYRGLKHITIIASLRN